VLISRDGLWKRLWRQSNNPIAPRKFPTDRKSAPTEGLLHGFFSLARIRRRRDRVAQSPSGLNARIVECQHRIAWQGCKR
jgi:hypothetical protein